jgi:hypothetical protein
MTRVLLFRKEAHCLMDVYAVLGTRWKFLAQKSNASGGDDMLWLLQKYYVQNRSKSRRLIGATDPRDRIFGLLGIARDSNALGIVPDYAKTVVEVYIHAARTLIEHNQLNVLSLAQSNKNFPDLPS